MPKFDLDEVSQMRIRWAESKALVSFDGLDDDFLEGRRALRDFLKDKAVWKRLARAVDGFGMNVTSVGGSGSNRRLVGVTREGRFKFKHLVSLRKNHTLSVRTRWKSPLWFNALVKPVSLIGLVLSFVMGLGAVCALMAFYAGNGAFGMIKNLPIFSGLFGDNGVFPMQSIIDDYGGDPSVAVIGFLGGALLSWLGSKLDDYCECDPEAVRAANGVAFGVVNSVLHRLVEEHEREARESDATTVG